MRQSALSRAAALLLAGLLLLSGCAPRPQPTNTPAAEPSAPAAESVPEPADPKPPESAPTEPDLPQEPQERRITLVAVGDLMAHWDQVEAALQPDGSYDFGNSFAPVAADLQEGYAIGNLETVFGGPDVGYSTYPRFSTPDAYGWAMKEAGFDFVSTCNNHSLDKDGPGALRTLELLDEMGIAHTGTYATEEESQRITLVEAEGMTIAILAFTFSTNGIPIPRESPWMVNMLTEEKLIADLAKAKALEPDLIVVMPHMGNEYETETKDVFLGWMDLALYHGADIVLASHPHVLQKMLVRDLTDAQGNARQGFIICSLGNFISVQRDEPRDMSIILKLAFSQQPAERPVLEQVSFVPVWVTYRDNTGAVNIRVVPVGDALEGLAGENPLGLNPWDSDRLWRANSQITALYLGTPASREELQREYVFYRRDSAPQ